MHGLPCSLYTDRGSHCFTTLKAGGHVHKDVSTQVGRALGKLGVEHIAAYSPEGRGRSERALRTLQVGRELASDVGQLDETVDGAQQVIGRHVVVEVAFPDD